jgi:hypothetical protein
LARETEVLGENLAKCRFVRHKHHMLLGSEPGPLELRHGLFDLFVRIPISIFATSPPLALFVSSTGTQLFISPHIIPILFNISS